MKTSKDTRSRTMKAWVLGGPGRAFRLKPSRVPVAAEKGRRCWCGSMQSRSAHRLENIWHGRGHDRGRATLQQEWTHGHETGHCRGRRAPAVDDTGSASAFTVESMPAAASASVAAKECTRPCHNPGSTTATVDKGHRAQRLHHDGGFCEYRSNHINTLVSIADDMWTRRPPWW